MILPLPNDLSGIMNPLTKLLLEHRSDAQQTLFNEYILPTIKQNFNNLATEAQCEEFINKLLDLKSKYNSTQDNIYFMQTLSNLMEKNYSNSKLTPLFIQKKIVQLQSKRFKPLSLESFMLKTH